MNIKDQFTKNFRLLVYSDLEIYLKVHKQSRTIGSKQKFELKFMRLNFIYIVYKTPK